jgi:hypothetical protein
MSEPILHIAPVQSLPPEVTDAASRLLSLVWPHVPGMPPRRMIQRADRADRVLAVLTEEGEALATAESFVLPVLIDGARCEILALAGVCTHPERRNSGLGRRIVLPHFARAELSGVAILFQTPVPEFYGKLGAVLFTGKVSDSTLPGTPPFWDPYAMWFPASVPQPREIDLCGPGF